MEFKHEGDSNNPLLAEGLRDRGGRLIPMVTTQANFMILFKYRHCVTVMSVIIKDVVYEMCNKPWRYTKGVWEASYADIKYIAAQTELHHRHNSVIQ